MEERVTEEVKAIERYILKTWGKHFATRTEVPLSQLFLKPDNPGLQHIWRYGSADLVAYRSGKPVAIIEPGGSHHFEEKQSLNDRRKWKLAELHGVRCLNMMNGLQAQLSKRKWRELIGGILFGSGTRENRTCLY